MTYKSNFEPYISQNPNRISFYDEGIDPLCTLYPIPNSPRSPVESCPSPFVGYNPYYWGDAYLTQPEALDESPRGTLQRVNDSRLVSKLRRLLKNREQQSRRRFFSNSTTHS